MTGIYKITNTSNGKFYIGSAVDIDTRWDRHRTDLRRRSHHNLHLQRAWDRDGEASFIFEVIEETTADVLLVREQFHLDERRAYDFRVGYNIGRSSSGGDNLTSNPRRDQIIKNISVGLKRRFDAETPEEKEARRQRLRGQSNPNFGRRWSAEARRQASVLRIGIPNPHAKHSIKAAFQWCRDNREVISQRVRGEGNPFYGRQHTPETRELLAGSKRQHMQQKRERGEKLAPNSKGVTIDGVPYISATDAARQLGLNVGTVLNRARNPKFPNYSMAE